MVTITQRALAVIFAVSFYFSHPVQSNPLNTPSFTQTLKNACMNTCSKDTDTCYAEYSEACHQYISCYKHIGADEYTQAFLYTCPLGLVWSQTRLTCIRREKSTCPDKCAAADAVPSYQNGPFCAQYYKCVDGVSMPTCCNRDHEYVDGQCVPISSGSKCRWNCPPAYTPVETTTESSGNFTTTIATETTTEMCTRSAVPGSPDKYVINDIKITALCARGTIFNQTKCDCVNDESYIPSTECYPEMVIDYASSNGGLKKDKGVDRHNGLGYFSTAKQSSSKIHHYAGNSNILSHFNLTVIFKSESTGDRKQFLITNCRSDIVDRPSIGIMVSNIDGTLLFVADDNAKADYDSIIKMTVKFKKGSWNWVRYIFDGRNLQATVVPLSDQFADPSAATEVYTKNVTLATETGDPITLLRSQSPLTIGSCNEHYFDGIIYKANLAGWVCSTYVDNRNKNNMLP